MVVFLIAACMALSTINWALSAVRLAAERRVAREQREALTAALSRSTQGSSSRPARSANCAGRSAGWRCSCRAMDRSCSIGG